MTSNEARKALVEKATKAMRLLDARTEQERPATWEEFAAAAIDEALEEAARVADEGLKSYTTMDDIPASIRKMKSEFSTTSEASRVDNPGG